MALLSAATDAVGSVTGIASNILGKGDKVQFIPAAGAAFVLDCAITEEHSRTSSPTEFPVEDGNTISDHIIIGPFELSITGIISDTPLGGVEALVKEAFTSAASALAPPLGVVVPATAYALAGALTKSNSDLPNTRSVKAYAQLLRLQAGDPTTSPPTPPQPFTVKTSLYRYTNMVIKSMTVPRSVQIGKALQFTVVLQQLRTVKASKVNVTVFSNSALAGNKGDLGEQSTSTVDGSSLGRINGNLSVGEKP